MDVLEAACKKKSLAAERCQALFLLVVFGAYSKGNSPGAKNYQQN